MLGLALMHAGRAGAWGRMHGALRWRWWGLCWMGVLEEEEAPGLSWTALVSWPAAQNGREQAGTNVAGHFRQRCVCISGCRMLECLVSAADCEPLHGQDCVKQVWDG